MNSNLFGGEQLSLGVPPAPPTAPTTGYSGTAVFFAAVAGAALGGVAMCVLPSKAAKADGEGPGYYVLLYNYQKGHRDRRLKGFKGPFSSKLAAQDESEAQKDVWYTSVRKLTNDPFTLGM
jgi:hypothetical protein